jgi:hypothetical protein
MKKRRKEKEEEEEERREEEKQRPKTQEFEAFHQKGRPSSLNFSLEKIGSKRK